MIRTQTWSPDTDADARFTEEWDWTDPDSPVFVQCIEARVGGVTTQGAVAAAQHAAILAKNQAKNEAIAAIEAALPDDMLKDELDDDNEPTGRRVVKLKHKPTFVLDDAQVVTIVVPGAPKELAAQLDKDIPQAKITAG